MMPSFPSVLGTLADRTDPKYLNEIPVVFTVVADPVGSGIIESYEKIGRDNVTGTRNRVPETVNIKSIRRYMPSFDHLGMLYEAATPNSVGKVEEVKGLTGALNFTLDAVPLDTLADGSPDPESIEPGIAALKSKGVQFIYLGSSAFLEKESDHFTGAALAAGIPVLTPYEHMVSDSQALMSVAARDYNVGKLAGEQVRRILVEGRRAGDIPVLAMEEFAYLVNMKVAKALNLYPLSSSCSSWRRSSNSVLQVRPRSARHFGQRIAAGFRNETGERKSAMRPTCVIGRPNLCFWNGSIFPVRSVAERSGLDLHRDQRGRRFNEKRRH